MFCPNCGEDAPPTAVFCAKCGTSIAPQQTAAPPAVGNQPAGYAAPVVPYPQAVVAHPQDDAKAIVSMILGILSLAGLGILAGIPAIILGSIARKNIRASGGRISGKGMATAGVVLGWISCGLMVVVVVIMVLVFAASEYH
jgi:hypothetical protein